MILLIDDDHAVRGMIGAVLGREGLRCDVAADGADAIQKLRERSYAAVLLDLILQRTHGLEVLRFLKSHRPDMLRRVVICSAVSEQTLGGLAERELVWGLLRKPFDIRELVATVRACREQSA